MKLSKTVLLLAIVLLSHNAAHSFNAEPKIQALFILKFIDNISWPENRKNVVIGVINSENDDVYTELTARLTKTNPNGIVVKKISRHEVGSVDVVYLPKAEAESIKIVNFHINGKAVVTISEADLSRKGSAISFVEDQGKMSFIINKGIIESLGLKVSNSILTLGKQS